MNLHPRQRALLQKIVDPKMSPIQKAGVLRALIEDAQFRGVPPNPEWVSRLQQLELWAQSRLTPQQLHRANLQAEQAKHEFRREVELASRAQQDDEARAQVDRSVREMTSGMLGHANGISLDQLRAIRGGKDVPRAEKARPSQEAIDAQWIKSTRHLDPKGKGWGEKEAIRRFDELADAKPEQFAKLARNFRGDVSSLRREVNFWSEQRIGYGVARKRFEQDIKRDRPVPERTTEPTARDSRRAAIVDAYMKTTGDQIERDSQRGHMSEAANDFNEVPYQLNEEHNGRPTRRAQIAEALLQSEATEAYEDDGS